jgi:hypothetical protein
MSSEDYRNLFIGLLFPQIPILIIAVWGLWHSIARKERYPRMSRSACWGFSLLIVNVLLGSALQVLLLRIRTAPPVSGVSGPGLWVSLLAMASYPFFIAGFALVARAIFLDRNITEQAEKEL